MDPRTAPPDDAPRARMLRILYRLRQEDPDSFAGVVLSSDNSIELLVTASTPATMRAIDDARESGQDSIPLRVIEGMKHSHADLEHLQDDVLKRCADLLSRGVHITEFGVDERANKVRVGVKGLTSERAEIVMREFGVERVYIVEGGEWAPTRSEAR
jgi:hypothetical protein